MLSYPYDMINILIPILQHYSICNAEVMLSWTLLLLYCTIASILHTVYMIQGLWRLMSQQSCQSCFLYLYSVPVQSCYQQVRIEMTQSITLICSVCRVIRKISKLSQICFIKRILFAKITTLINGHQSMCLVINYSIQIFLFTHIFIYYTQTVYVISVESQAHYIIGE